jgi:hypothetical protein
MSYTSEYLGQMTDKERKQTLETWRNDAARKQGGTSIADFISEIGLMAIVIYIVLHLH